jgi:hypothetical protein
MISNKESFQSKFLNLRTRYASYCICKIQKKIDKARDEDFAREQYLPSILNFDFSRLHGFEKTIMESFEYDYRLGSDADEILPDLIKDIGYKIEYMDEFMDQWGNKMAEWNEEDREKAREELFLDRRDELIQLSNPNNLLRLVAKNYGERDLRDHFKSPIDGAKTLAAEFQIESHKPTEIEWTGDPKTGKLDFIKLIYGMHHAGLLNNGEGEITKITESVAYHFNVKLGKSWQSSLTRNRQERNIDYDHFKVFKEIQESYAKYMERKDQKS